MAHRAAMIGATFGIEPGPTGGTLVKCSWPVAAAAFLGRTQPDQESHG
jgi:hypothetical protein